MCQEREYLRELPTSSTWFLMEMDEPTLYQPKRIVDMSEANSLLNTEKEAKIRKWTGLHDELQKDTEFKKDVDALGEDMEFPEQKQMEEDRYLRDAIRFRERKREGYYDILLLLKGYFYEVEMVVGVARKKDELKMMRIGIGYGTRELKGLYDMVWCRRKGVGKKACVRARSGMRWRRRSSVARTRPRCRVWPGRCQT